MKVFLLSILISGFVYSQTNSFELLQQYADSLRAGLIKIDSMKLQLQYIEKLITNRRILKWSGGDPDGDTVTYKIYFGMDSTNLFLTAITQDTFCLSGYQQKAHTYYWQVTADDGINPVVYGPIWHYSTEPDTVQVRLNFDDLNNNRVLGDFDYQGFHFSGHIATNYGYNFDVNGTSLFYLFKDDTLTISCPYIMDFEGFSCCQLSGMTSDTLMVEGFEDGLKKYENIIPYGNQWTDLMVDFRAIDEIKFRMAGNIGLSDFNFDKFLFDVKCQ